jgi:hypothetical protein
MHGALDWPRHFGNGTLVEVSLRGTVWKRLGLGLALLLASTCGGDVPTGGVALPGRGDQPVCSIPTNQIFDGGVGIDGIPALTDPLFVSPDNPGADYLLDSDRVLGIRVGDLSLAVPHNILWWHEIVNLNFSPDLRLAVTYCPLTGSGIVFDRSAVDGAELGVSGLLFRNNLIMYDRREGSSLFPQMMGEAACGPSTGLRLPTYPAAEMTWRGWRALHPETGVLSSATSFRWDYTRYPYGSYENLGNTTLLFPLDEIDRSRPPKERVLGIPDTAGGGLAFPFEALADQGVDLRAVHFSMSDGAGVVLWSSEVQAATAFFRRLDGQTLDFEVRGGEFVDVQTESVWTLEGEALSGPLQGRELKPVRGSYVAFWFAWAAFHPGTELWRQEP